MLKIKEALNHPFLAFRWLSQLESWLPLQYLLSQETSSAKKLFNYNLSVAPTSCLTDNASAMQGFRPDLNALLLRVMSGFLMGWEIERSDWAPNGGFQMRILNVLQCKMVLFLITSIKQSWLNWQAIKLLLHCSDFCMTVKHFKWCIVPLRYNAKFYCSPAVKLPHFTMISVQTGQLGAWLMLAREYLSVFTRCPDWRLQEKSPQLRTAYWKSRLVPLTTTDDVSEFWRSFPSQSGRYQPLPLLSLLKGARGHSNENKGCG